MALVVRCFPTLRFWILLNVALAAPAWCGTADAQAVEARVGVLRSTHESTPAELAEAVDAALLRDLAAIAGIRDPVVSPIDVSEIQLSVGCTDDGRACLGAMARAAGVGALLVRSLTVGADGAARLELRYFDSASSDEPRAVSAERPAPSRDDLAQAVPTLVRELFGIPEVAEAAAPVADEGASPTQADPSAAEDGGGSIVPWLLVGAGAAALTTGVIVAAVASGDFDDWKAREVRTTADAERADARFDAIETRAVVANVAMIGGAVIAGVGLTLLVLEANEDSAEALEAARLRVRPLSGGVALQLQGAFRGGW